MDSRIYFHQYRRPRVSNPTYLSSNVQNSMSFFNPPSTQPTRRDYALQDHYQAYRSNSMSLSMPPQQYRQQDIPQRYQQTKEPSYEQKQPVSKLSNYGERVMGEHRMPVMDQKGIHDKQTSKFDIINMKPRQHNQEIKQYPWLTIENRDDVYYRRMNEIYNNAQPRSKTIEKPSSNLAGRHTYDLQQKLQPSPNPEPKGYFPSKMLNHMDELQHNLA